LTSATIATNSRARYSSENRYSRSALRLYLFSLLYLALLFVAMVADVKL